MWNVHSPTITKYPEACGFMKPLDYSGFSQNNNCKCKNSNCTNKNNLVGQIGNNNSCSIGGSLSKNHVSEAECMASMCQKLILQKLSKIGNNRYIHCNYNHARQYLNNIKANVYKIFLVKVKLSAICVQQFIRESAHRLYVLRT